jgi:hypothetical protein
MVAELRGAPRAGSSGDGHRPARIAAGRAVRFAKARITPQGWVFTHENGEPLSPSYLTRTFSDLVEGDRPAAGTTARPPARRRHADAARRGGTEDDRRQLGHSSVVLTADTYLSVAIELGLKAAAAGARLVLKAGRSPPGAASEDAAPPRWPRSPPDIRHLGARRRRRGPALPERPEDPDHADPARQPGLQHALEKNRTEPTGSRSPTGPDKTMTWHLNCQVTTGAPPGT